MRVMHNALHEDAWCVDLVGVKVTGFDENLYFSHGDASAGNGHGIKIACGFAIDEIAARIALPGLHQRKVSADAALKNVRVPVELALLLALSYRGANAGTRVEAWNACAAGAHPFGQCTLRAELDF